MVAGRGGWFFKICLRFRDRQSRVIHRIGFVGGAKVRNSLNYSFRCIATGKRSHCVSPIALGLGPGTG